METKLNESIRLTEGQTELLTKALVEAAEQAARPKAPETEIVAKPLAKPAGGTTPAKLSAKKPMVI